MTAVVGSGKPGGRIGTMMAVGLLLAACAAGRTPPDQDPDPAGCYRFEDGPGARPLGLPWGVVLAPDPLPGGWPLMDRFEDVRRARTATSRTGRTDHPFGYWRPVSGDSLEVGHPGGGGIVLVVAPTAEGLAGRGRAAGDALGPEEAPGPRPDHPVRARRIACPAGEEPSGRGGPPGP